MEARKGLVISSVCTGQDAEFAGSHQESEISDAPLPVAGEWEG